MNPELEVSTESSPHPLASVAPRWRIWLVRAGMFSVMFVMLLLAFSALGSIVERFFIALYTD